MEREPAGISMQKKRQIVAETQVGGAQVSLIAQRHGIRTTLIRA